MPVLQKNRAIVVDIADPMGNIGTLFFNHLYPPFNDVRARRAFLTAMSQEYFMIACVGEDRQMWKPMPGYFTPGAPLYTENGGEILTGKRDLAAARRLLAESGYAGETIVSMAAQDAPVAKAFGDVTADLLTRLGMKVDHIPGPFAF